MRRRLSEFCVQQARSGNHVAETLELETKKPASRKRAFGNTVSRDERRKYCSTAELKGWAILLHA
jgi:hypothetical protein